MAIDVNTEKLITMTQAAGLVLRRRAGRKTAVSTLYRWTATGIRGVVLECVQIGGTRCTSVQAMRRFFDRLTICSRPQEPSP